MTAPRILITGANGMLGRTLAQAWHHRQCDATDRAHLDIANRIQVDSVLDALRPEVVINCAAFTAVDRCETEVALAWQANAQGPAILARSCNSRNIRLIHISTDYVFAGDLDRPYSEE